MGKSFSIEGETGVPFSVHIIDKGDCYGLNDAVVHQEDDPLVIFYDSSVERSEFQKHGMYASSYYMSSLLEHNKNSALWLDAGNPDYRLNAETMNKVVDYLELYNEGFSINSFNRQEMKEVAFLYSDYVSDVAEDSLYTGNSPVTLSEFVEHDLEHSVQALVGIYGEESKIHMQIKRKMEFFGYQFEDEDEKLHQRASRNYLSAERE